MTSKTRYFLVTAAFLSLAVLVSCATNPETREFTMFGATKEQAAQTGNTISTALGAPGLGGAIAGGIWGLAATIYGVGKRKKAKSAIEQADQYLEAASEIIAALEAAKEENRATWEQYLGPKLDAATAPETKYIVDKVLANKKATEAVKADGESGT